VYIVVRDEDVNKLWWIIIAIVVVAVIAGLLGIPSMITEWLIQWLVSMIVGGVMSIVAGELVEAFTGDWLKKISLNFSIFGLEVSLSAFLVATVLVKFWLFRSF
jgi:hypothetical protein